MSTREYKEPPLAWKILRPILKTAVWLGIAILFVNAIGDAPWFPYGENANAFENGYFLGLILYTILLIVLYCVRLKRRAKAIAGAFVEMLDSFKGEHIDEVLRQLPPPTKSVKHRGSQYISYYWVTTSRSFTGFSIPLGRGIRYHTGGMKGTKETLTLLVDPETSTVVDWQQSEG
jgi:hypothetical protein